MCAVFIAIRFTLKLNNIIRRGQNNGDNKLTVTSKSCTNAGIIVVYYNL